jgi:hypothetical protein
MRTATLLAMHVVALFGLVATSVSLAAWRGELWPFDLGFSELPIGERLFVASKSPLAWTYVSLLTFIGREISRGGHITIWRPTPRLDQSQTRRAETAPLSCVRCERAFAQSITSFRKRQKRCVCICAKEHQLVEISRADSSGVNPAGAQSQVKSGCVPGIAGKAGRRPFGTSANFSETLRRAFYPEVTMLRTRMEPNERCQRETVRTRPGSIHS